jgi:hypothetical protein
MIFTESMAWVNVVHDESKAAATGSNSSVPGNSPVAPTVLRVTMATLYFILSPYIMILEIAGQRDLTPSSTGTYFFLNQQINTEKQNDQQKKKKKEKRENNNCSFIT